jgi:N-acetylglucosamine kinase-like BadF-type ATPase
MKKSNKSDNYYYIGIDCGASVTEALVLKETSETLKPGEPVPCKLYKFQPINFNVHGLSESIKRLESIIKKVIKSLEKNKIKHIAAGISGARNVTDRNKIKRVISNHLKIKNISVLADTDIAFASVFGPYETNCGILIAGTGSILYFKNGNGEINRIGGWGRHLGDEGSGYWIAKEALNRVTRHFDGRSNSSKLANSIETDFGLNINSLIKKIYHNNFEISKITKSVFRYAEAGDEDSIDIIKCAAEHLADHLKPLRDMHIKMALLGSLFTEEKLLRKHFENIVSNEYPEIKFVLTNRKPVWGAITLAKNIEQ